MIEDTSFVIDLLRGHSDAIQFRGEIEQRRIPEKLSSITCLELYEGVSLIDKSDEEKQKLGDVLRRKTIIPADYDIMVKAGKLSGELIQKGQQIDREDCIIAATALLEDEPVVTRNLDHFQRIPNLLVKSY